LSGFRGTGLRSLVHHDARLHHWDPLTVKSDHSEVVRYLIHQKGSALARWYQASVAAGKERRPVVVALARKLLIALWRFVTVGDVPQGVILRLAS
jgi:hypothetical protein